MRASKSLTLDQLRLMVPAYVLDALQPAEREAFERALAASSHKAVLQAEIELQRLAVDEMTAERADGVAPSVTQRMASLLSAKVTPPSVDVFTPPPPRPEFILPGGRPAAGTRAGWGGETDAEREGPIGGQTAGWGRRRATSADQDPAADWLTARRHQADQRASWMRAVLAGVAAVLLLAFGWQLRRANDLEVRLDIATRRLEANGIVGEAPPPAAEKPAPRPAPAPALPAVAHASPAPKPAAPPPPAPKPVPIAKPVSAPPAPAPAPAPTPKPVPAPEDPATRVMRAVLGGQGTLTIVTLEPALPKGRGAVQLLWNAPVGAGVVRASGLPPLAATQGYMLWMLQRNTLVPVVRFTADAKGAASVPVPTMPKSTAGVTLFTVTVEPAGVKQPTSVPLLAGDVPAAAPAR